VTLLLLRCMLVLPVLFVLCLPVWWAAGRLESPRLTPFFRLLVAAGGAIVGWIGVINLAGRALQDASVPRWAWLALNAVATLWLLARRRDELALRSLGASWRSWLPALLLALLVGAPQWLLAVSTPYWDEVASSSIHITAPNQFAEGLFPPRHNAFPDLPVKYHYGVTMLAGTVIWLTGVSTNVSIDVVSTSLHLFVFLFIFHWLAQLGFRRLACFTGSFAVLLGGGLGWLYVPWLETYEGFPKRGVASALDHHYKPALGWWGNLLDSARTAVFHLHNPDGSNSNLPWDVVAQFQQHAVALGLALTVFCAWLFCTWILRERRLSPWLLGACTFSFGLLFLGHAMFGMVSCLTAGLLLAGRWLARPSRALLLEAMLFTAGVGALAFAHGGLLSRGEAYGPNQMALTRRTTLGYSDGGLLGFLNWNVAGFGLSLLLALAVFAIWPKRHSVATQARRHVFAFFAVMLLVSYLPPQLLFYSYGGNAIEEYTEVAKFFFATHLALGMLAAFAITLAARPLPAWLVLPACAAMAIVPVFHVYAASFDANDRWLGFYRSPFAGPQLASAVRMGEALHRLKQTNHDVYFDAAWHDEHRDAFVDELQIFGGSVFGVTPRRYERTGGFLISTEVVAQRSLESSRMARLLPGAEADAGCNWYYTRPSVDFLRLPAIVRSRFDKLVADGTYREAARDGERVLYQIAGSSAGLDDGIERYWRPRAVVQTRHGSAGSSDRELAFYDRREQRILQGTDQIPLPTQLGADFVAIQRGRFGEDGRLDMAAARMADSYFARGAQMAQLVESNAFYWSFHDSVTGTWTAEFPRWGWDREVPLLADLTGDGVQELVAWNRSTGTWLRGERAIPGAVVKGSSNAVPLIGRFVAGGSAMLAVYETSTGALTMLPASGRAPSSQTSFRMGAPGDILVPGDYDGDGLDELVLFRRTDSSWTGRSSATGTSQIWKFGSPSAIPVPADYDGDGALDLGYWEPAEREIRVSFDRGQSVGRVIPVPPDSLPAFVNMY
jgi:hypothetical protein